MDARGISSGSAKSIALSIQVNNVRAAVVPPSVAGNVRLTLNARFGDGTETSVDGVNGSAFGVTRALEGAIQAALNTLVIDPRFIAYLNR